MTEYKQLADTPRQSILDKDATLADGSRAAADYDNSTELDLVADAYLFVGYDTTAPTAGDLVAELYNLTGDGETPEMFQTGGDGTVGRDVNPSRGLVGTFTAINPSIKTGTITGATAANPVVISDTAHGLTGITHTYISGVGGMTEINDRFFEVERIDDDSYRLLGENGSGHTAYTSGGTWWEVDVLEIKNLPLGPNGNRFVVENVSGQLFGAEWELKAKPKKAQSA